MKILLALLLATTTLTGTAHARAAADCSRAGQSDFDGDGQDDVVVGDPFADGGRGSVSIISAGKVVPVPVSGLSPGDGFGWSVRLARLNSDGCADLLIGAPYTDVNGTVDAGAAYVVYGGAAAQPTQLLAPQPQRDAHFGWSLAAKGDLIAIGAPYEDQAQLADAGSVYVRRGSGSLRRIQEDSDGVLGNAEVGDQFGWSLAFAAGNALVVGVPYENDDGPGRQVASGKIDSGSVTVLKDVLAPTLTSLKIDSPSKTAGDKYGYAIAYSDSAGLAVSAPGPGYVQVFGKDFKPTRTVRGTAGFGLALAASTDGRFAAASPDSVETTAGQSFPVAASALAFGGNRLYVGMPDGGRRGSVSYAGRNDSSLNALEPAKGEDFGAALGGG